MVKQVIKYRVAQARDALALAELLNIANYGIFVEHYSKEVTKKGEVWQDVVCALIRNPQSEYYFNNVFVAIVDKKIAGAMFTLVNPDPFIVEGLEDIREDIRNPLKLRMKVPGSFWLRDLAVFPEHRNFLRIGMRLIQVSIAAGFERGFTQITGMVHDTNHKLMRYYQSIGAQPTDRINVGQHPTYAHESQWNLLVLTKDNWKNTGHIEV